METNTTPKTTAKDFFLYLFSFGALYVSAVSLISLLFAMINKALPDALNSYYYYGGDPYTAGVRAAVASLLIVFPLYLVAASYIDRYVRANPEKKDLWVRKWLTYLTIFVTAVAVIVDLIVLVNTFLGGEITSRFVWKVLSVLVVSGAVFSYYWYDLRKSFAPDSPRRTGLIVALACVLVFGSLVAGFVVAGSPMRARALRFDERRQIDLGNIENQVVYYWQQKGMMPMALSDLSDPVSGFTVPVDPQTGKGYEYRLTQREASFQLCADFQLPSPAARDASVGYAFSKDWNHGAGPTCFDRTIDKDFYPVRGSASVPATRAY
ncbi:MAG TPA: DUF5671 domain-containing protein [Candidatus Paceibacterota bacterium]|nr:DUF5671 domain-containing protein [Candidatus Paceibacterota bacterium]